MSAFLIDTAHRPKPSSPGHLDMLPSWLSWLRLALENLQRPQLRLDEDQISHRFEWPNWYTVIMSYESMVKNCYGDAGHQDLVSVLSLFMFVMLHCFW